MKKHEEKHEGKKEVESHAHHKKMHDHHISEAKKHMTKLHHMAKHAGKKMEHKSK